MSQSPGGTTDRRRGERRKADRRRSSPRAGILAWIDLHRPTKLLIYLLIALVLIEVYRQAEFIVTKVLGVLLLFVFAAIVALLLTPLVDDLQKVPRLANRRGLAVLILNLFLLGVLAIFLLALIPPLVQQGVQLGQEAPSLFGKVQSLINAVEQSLASHGIPVKVSGGPGVESLIAPAVGSAISVLSQTVGILIDLIVVAVISIYLEIEGRQLIKALRQLFPSQQQLYDFTLVAAGSTLSSYVRGQVIFAAVMSAFTAISMSIIGVHFALVIAVISFVLELVPLVGAPIAIVFVIAVSSLQGPGTMTVASITTIVGHLIGAYTVGLRVIGNATRLHPLVALAALLLGADLGGVLGALFAVPLAGILNVYLGAIYRAGIGQEAFVLPEADHSDEVIEQLPRLGDEIKQAEEADSSYG